MFIVYLSYIYPIFIVYLGLGIGRRVVEGGLGDVKSIIKNW